MSSIGIHDMRTTTVLEFPFSITVEEVTWEMVPGSYLGEATINPCNNNYISHTLSLLLRVKTLDQASFDRFVVRSTQLLTSIQKHIVNFNTAYF